MARKGHDDGRIPEVVYGFIGLGNMGFGMAKNLRRKIPKESKLILCEINNARRDEFLSEVEGLNEAVKSPREVAQQADIILTMLPNAKAVELVFTDPEDGLLSTSNSLKPKFFLECSTIEVAASAKVLKAVQSSGLGDFIDAPVSGGIPAADQGTLTFMVGASEGLFERAKPILALMGKKENIIYCGGPGAGLATKQINNYIANVSFVALCEGMNTGLRFGLDPKILANVINVSSGMCWNSLNMNPVKGVQPHSSAAKDFEGGFRTELAKGVTDMAVQLMEEVEAKQVMAPVLQHVYAKAVQDPRCADKECRSIYRLITEDGKGVLGETKIEQASDC